ncbi:MAG: DNA repair protein [Eubacterium sp.]|nr:DNA repair protein [Eubacterium sp.]
MDGKYYICIDLKSFYASVECAERGLDPMTTNLVVADPERSDKTICLAVSPSMKKFGVRNRCRVFEIPKSIKYIMAVPRMQKYIDYAADIYGIYLRYIAPEDIHVYSIDESFIDVTPYLNRYKKTPKEMAEWFMGLIWDEIGIRATAGVGTNLYLTKIALDIISKHAPDFIGVLDEESFKEKLWDHQPLTDFWRIGPGTARSLASLGIFTMRQIAAFDEDTLYRKFGIDAELLIDHAWGRESTTMADIKAYRSETKSLTQGQVLMRDYSFEEGRVVMREMVEQLALDLVAKKLLTQSVTILAGYSNKLHMPMSGGTASVPVPTSSSSMLVDAVMKLYDDVVDSRYPIRRFFAYCNNVTPDTGEQQLSLFDETIEEKETDRRIQNAMVDIKKKFGKNAIFKSADLQECATQLERNMQIGGHKSGNHE